MFGAIVGDIVGSMYEFHNIKTKDFPLFGAKCDFTDDTVMTIAVANALNTYRMKQSLAAFRNEVASQMRALGRGYPNRGYGRRFTMWLRDDTMGPYNSFGNGSAMRVSPVAWAAGSVEEAEMLAQASAEPTHNHPEGIKGAQAVAAAIYLGRVRKSKEEIRAYIKKNITSLISRWMKSVKATPSTRPARAAYPRLSRPFLNPRASRTPSATPCPSAGIRTRSPPSPAVSPRPFTARFPRISEPEPYPISWRNSAPAAAFSPPGVAERSGLRARSWENF